MSLADRVQKLKYFQDKYKSIEDQARILKKLSELDASVKKLAEEKANNDADLESWFKGALEEVPSGKTSFILQLGFFLQTTRLLLLSFTSKFL